MRIVALIDDRGVIEGILRHLGLCFWPCAWSLQLLPGLPCATGAADNAVLNDYDGDGKADLAVYDTGEYRWYIRTITGTVIVGGDLWGASGLVPVPCDYETTMEFGADRSMWSKVG